MDQNSQQQVRIEEGVIVNQYNFLIEEYKTLLEEIKATKDRIFKIAGISAAGMPYSYFIANENDLQILKISLPLLVFAVMMLYVSENRSLMRCGKYIKDCIEPIIIELKRDRNMNILNKWKGWECFLAEKDGSGFMRNPQRSAERIAASFFYIFFIIHYIVSARLSVGAFYLKYKDAGWYCSLTFWSVVGVFFIIYLILVFKKSISTTD